MKARPNLLAILALVLVCAACRQTATNTRPVTDSVSLSKPADRPWFYNENNIAEYYGRCPTCQRWVKGHFSTALYGDATGKAVGCESAVRGTCKRCKADLVAKAELDINHSRIVTWNAPTVLRNQGR